MFIATTSYYWANESSVDLTFYFYAGGLTWGLPYAATAIGDWAMYADRVSELDSGPGDYHVVRELFVWGVEAWEPYGSYNVSFTTKWYVSDGSLKETHVTIESSSVDTEMHLIRLDGPSEGLLLYVLGAAVIAVVLVIIIVIRRRK